MVVSQKQLVSYASGERFTTSGLHFKLQPAFINGGLFLSRGNGKMMQNNGRRVAYKQEAMRLMKRMHWKAKTFKNAIYWKAIAVKNAIYWEAITVKNAVYWKVTAVCWKAITVKNDIYWRFYYSPGFAHLLSSVFVKIFVRKLPKDYKVLEKFVLVTRGRTGSTAIVDELDKASQLLVMQELFIPGDFAGSPLDCGKDGDYYSVHTPPFDLWKRPERWWQRIIPACCRDARQAHHYLMCTEKLAKQKALKGFGWKLLSHQFNERPYLAGLLKKHGYRAVYLRRSAASQVLSGLVANQRGIYNSLEKVVDERRCHINLDEFRWHVKLEQECVRRDLAQLSVDGLDFIVVDYEEFCNNREAFFGKIFGLFNFSLELPPRGKFMKIIEDPGLVIENYAEVKNVAAELGESH